MPKFTGTQTRLRHCPPRSPPCPTFALPYPLRTIGSNPPLPHSPPLAMLQNGFWSSLFARHLVPNGLAFWFVDLLPGRGSSSEVGNHPARAGVAGTAQSNHTSGDVAAAACPPPDQRCPNPRKRSPRHRVPPPHRRMRSLELMWGTAPRGAQNHRN